MSEICVCLLSSDLWSKYLLRNSYIYRIMDKKSSRALMLILTTFTYLLLGAAVFDILEGETERYVREEIAFVREKLQRKYNFTSRYSIFIVGVETPYG